MTDIRRRPIAGNLRWRDGNQIDITVAVDRLAIDNTRLAMLSCVGHAQDIKALRAALHGGTGAPMEFNDLKGYGLTLVQGSSQFTPRHVYAAGTRYAAEAFRLAYGIHHAIFVSTAPGLMLEDGDEALWAELKHPRYTTPLLRAWLPYLRQELAQARLLRPLACLDCRCMGLTATTKDLDGIVEHGLKNGLIIIEEESAA
jgi:hypothetical protein